MALAYLVPTANMSGTLSGSATTNDYTQLDNGPTTNDTAGFVAAGDETGLVGTYAAISNTPSLSKINSATFYVRARINGVVNDTLTWRVRGIHDSTNFDLTWSQTDTAWTTKNVTITSPTKSTLDSFTVQVENTVYTAVKGSDNAAFQIDEIWVTVDYEVETGERYWVGGAGEWNSTNATNWSSTSGGSGGYFAPTSSQDVFFNANSDAGSSFTVTIGAGAVSDNLTISGLDQTMNLVNSLNGDPLDVYGNFTLSATNLTNNYSGTIRFRNSASSTTNTITTDGVNLGPVEFLGSSSTTASIIQLAGGMTTDSATFTSGIVDLNNQTLSAGAVTILQSELNFGTGKIVITGNANTILNLTGAEFYAYGSKTVELSYGSSTGTRTITFPENGSIPLNFIVNGGSDTITFTAGSVVDSLNFAGSTAFSGTWTNTAFRIRGDLTLSSSMTVGSGSNTVEFTRDGAITTAGKTLDFPVNIDSSFLIQQARLLNSDFSSGDNSTWRVDIDNDTLILGIPGHDTPATGAGAAYIFVRTNGVWSQQAKLTASDAEASDFFGNSVAIYGDTVVVGAYAEHGAGTDRGAAYVFTRSGTTWTEQQKLTASDAADNDYFGYSVAIDGDTVVVGAWLEDGAGGGTDRGAAYVFTRSGTTWTQQQKLTASDTADSDFFGNSVAIYGDTVVVGAYAEDGAGSDRGAAYVFTRSGTTWTERQKLTASDAADSDFFGYSVAIDYSTSLLTNVIVVGAATVGDAVYIFTGSGASWTQQQILTSPVSSTQDSIQNFGERVAIAGDYIAVTDPNYDSWTQRTGNLDSNVGAVFLYKLTSSSTWVLDQVVSAHTNTDIVGTFPDDISLNVDSTTGEMQLATAHYTGTSDAGAHVYVSKGYYIQDYFRSNDWVSGDTFGEYAIDISGDTVIVGSRGKDLGQGTDRGAAYVFVRSGDSWIQQQKLTASDAANSDFFGHSVSIDGDSVIVGAYAEDGAGTNRGAAYVFTRSGTTWTEQQKLTASDAADSDQFGYSVAIDGDSVIVGADSEDGAGTNRGAAYVFTRSAGTWTQQQKLTASDAADNDSFGDIVAISSDTVIIGARGEDGAGTDRGAAYVFTRSGTTWTQQQKLTASDAADNDEFGYWVAIDGDTCVVGAIYESGDSTLDRGAAYVFTRSGTTWTQQQKLTASDFAESSYFGETVAIQGDTIVVGSSGSVTGASWADGAAYVFTRSGTTWTQQQKIYSALRNTTYQIGYGVAIDGEYIAVSGNESYAQVHKKFGSVSLADNFTMGSSRALSLWRGEFDANDYTVTIGKFFSSWDYKRTLSMGSGLWTLSGTGIVWTTNTSTNMTLNKETADILLSDTSTTSRTFEGGGLTYNKLTIGGTTGTSSTSISGSNTFSELASTKTVAHTIRFGPDQATTTLGNFTVSGTSGNVVTLEPFDVGVGDEFYFTKTGAGIITDIDYLNITRSNASPSSGTWYAGANSVNNSTWGERAKLTASDAEASDFFGGSVSIDGDSVIVGADSEDGAGTNRGAAYVFTRSGTTWTEQQKLTASDAADNDSFGNSVAIDGDTVIVSARAEDGAGSSRGAAYVFTRSAGTWTEQQKLTASDAADSDLFGTSVAIDGDTVVVGADSEDGAGSSRGAAYVFTRSAGTWTEQQKLTASDVGNLDQFGYSVSIAGDTVVVGAFGEDGAGSDRGAAYLFTRSGTTWTEQQKLTASDAENTDYFGFSVSTDGDNVIAGAYLEDGAGNSSGAAYVFDYNTNPGWIFAAFTNAGGNFLLLFQGTNL